jgi:hypothetical protein
VVVVNGKVQKSHQCKQKSVGLTRYARIDLVTLYRRITACAFRTEDELQNNNALILISMKAEKRLQTMQVKSSWRRTL